MHTLLEVRGGEIACSAAVALSRSSVSGAVLLVYEKVLICVLLRYMSPVFRLSGFVSPSLYASCLHTGWEHSSL